MNIIIPATGIGKRFKEAGYKDLKPFIKVMEDKIILDYVIECFDIQNDTFYFIIQESEKTNLKILFHLEISTQELLFMLGKN